MFGLAAIGADILRDPVHNDVLTDRGFIHALVMCMELDPTCGLLWQAVVCSSWIWMALSSTLRSHDCPLGEPGAATNIANRMVARCGLLILLVIASGCNWIVEQPSSSLMKLHPTIEWIKSKEHAMVNSVWHKVDTYMGAFGAKTIKPTQLWGNTRIVLALARERPRDTTCDSSDVAIVTKDPVTGWKRTTGGPGLKSTQAYTDEFGEAVGKHKETKGNVAWEGTQDEFGEVVGRKTKRNKQETSHGRGHKMSLERLWEEKQKETKGNVAGEGRKNEFEEAVLQAYLALGTGSKLPDADAQPDLPYHVPPGVFSLAALHEVLRFAQPDA